MEKGPFTGCKKHKRNIKQKLCFVMLKDKIAYQKTTKKKRSKNIENHTQIEAICDNHIVFMIRNDFW